MCRQTSINFSCKKMPILKKPKGMKHGYNAKKALQSHLGVPSHYVNGTGNKNGKGLAVTGAT